MFDSVLRPDFSQTRFGTGALVALAAHAIVATLAVTLSGQKPKAIVDPPRWPIVKIHRSTPLISIRRLDAEALARAPPDQPPRPGSTGEEYPSAENCPDPIGREPDRRSTGTDDWR